MNMNRENGNVVLIGMPGAGKSTIGVVLAKMLNRGFLDADLLIQERQRATLQEIIDSKGRDGFVRIEGDVLSGIDAERTIIATGGSAVYSASAMAHLAEIGIIVYLEIAYSSLARRLGDLYERGVVLNDGDGRAMGLRDLYEERRPLYERYAEITVNVDGLDITAAARKVASALLEEHANRV